MTRVRPKPSRALATIPAASPAPTSTGLSWSDIVFEKGGVPMADSRKVAEVFGKRHDHVLRDINIVQERWPDRAAPNFGASEYTDPTGRKLACYHMTRKGFSFLALAWKTPRAEAFKWQFLDAFDDMEAELRRRLDQDRVRLLAETKAALVETERDKANAVRREETLPLVRLSI